MYKLVAFLLPLLLLASCSKNPTNSVDKATENGKMRISVTSETSGASKASISTLTSTVSMKIFIMKTGWATPRILTPTLNSDLSFDVVNVEVPYGGMYTVTVTGYDKDGVATWSGSQENIFIKIDEVQNVNIILKDVRI